MAGKLLNVPDWVTAPCAVCGDPNASSILFPPLVETPTRLCHAHWICLPSTQALYLQRLMEAADDNEVLAE